MLDIKNVEIVKRRLAQYHDVFSVLELAGTFTASQMIQRDMFQNRLEKGMDINLVEFFYPLMQGYDSVALQADVEIGGTDQLLYPRWATNSRAIWAKPQDIITVPILEGTSGKEKMSKSLNNFIDGRGISTRCLWKDYVSPWSSFMSKYFELLTDFHTSRNLKEFLNSHPSMQTQTW